MSLISALSLDRRRFGGYDIVPACAIRQWKKELSKKLVKLTV